MGRKKQFSDMDLNKALGEGLTNKQMSKKFGVSPASISTRVAALKRRNTGALIAESTRNMVTDRLKTFDQLEKINTVANQIMDRSIAEEPELALRAAGEIRAQLKLQADLLVNIFSMKKVQLFQDTVMECLHEVSPEMRQDFIRILNEKKEMQGVVTYGS